MNDNARQIIHGARVILREPRPSDELDRVEAGLDPEFAQMVGHLGPDPPTLAEGEVRSWYARIAANPHAWIVEYHGRCIGAARLDKLDPSTRDAWYAIGLFRPEHRGQGFGQEVTRLVLSHAFGPLALDRVRLRVLEFNQRAIACYQQCGFAEVAREPVQLGDIAAIDVIMEARSPLASSAA